MLQRQFRLPLRAVHYWAERVLVVAHYSKAVQHSKNAPEVPQRQRVASEKGKPDCLELYFGQIPAALATSASQISHSANRRNH